MSADLIARLRAQLGGPRDGALLRFSLGTALLSNGDARGAVAAFREAVGFDRDVFGGVEAARQGACRKRRYAGGALDAYRRGLDVARTRGDKQVEKEMRCFCGA